ncbi:MAG: hypothetical protein HKN58_01050 [Xanthomonadales bacterium]|nr:hypothetical protein [Xanthomonadales bacterium]
MRRVKRIMVGLPVLVLVGVLAVASARWGVASLDTWQASRVLEQLLTAREFDADRAALLERGLGFLDDAERRAGPHPDVHDRRGQMYYWAAMNQADAGLERGQMLERAAEEYRASLALRPMWPYTWANLAVVKAEAGIFDREFRTAVRRTVETGPWEPGVQLQLIRVDFAEQQRLDRQSRALIDTMLVRAAQRQPDRVARLAARYGQTARLCGMPQFASELSACKR